MNALLLPALHAALLGAALVAGVFFAFSSFVMPALARLPRAMGIAAMQSINLTVINRLFLGVFFGTAALSAACMSHRDPGFWGAVVKQVG